MVGYGRQVQHPLKIYQLPQGLLRRLAISPSHRQHTFRTSAVLILATDDGRERAFFTGYGVHLAK